jgi:hypothetical protein
VSKVTRPEPRTSGPPWPATVVQNDRHYNFESDLEYRQLELLALSLGQAPPPKPPRPKDDRLVPIREAAARFGLSRRSVGRLIREHQRHAMPAVPKPSDIAAE